MSKMTEQHERDLNIRKFDGPLHCRKTVDNNSNCFFLSTDHDECSLYGVPLKFNGMSAERCPNCRSNRIPSENVVTNSLLREIKKDLIKIKKQLGII